MDEILALNEDIIADSDKLTNALENIGVESGLIDGVKGATASILELK